MEDDRRTKNEELILFRLEALQGQVKDLKRSIETNYVTVDQFRPVKAVAIGFVSIILSTFGVALVSLVLKNQ